MATFHGRLTADKFNINGNVVRDGDRFLIYGMEYIKGYLTENSDFYNSGNKFEYAPDGSVAKKNQRIFTVTVSDPTKVQEYKTIFQRLWYPIAVATLSRYCRDILLQPYNTYKKLSPLFGPYNLNFVDYQLQDFGFRGCASIEQSIIGGSAHLLNFSGSDTMSASFYAEQMNGKPSGAMGVSLPASEHSVMTSYELEEDAMLYIMMQFGSGLFAVVMDSYDYERSLTQVFPSALTKYLYLIAMHIIPEEVTRMAAIELIKSPSVADADKSTEILKHKDYIAAATNTIKSLSLGEAKAKLASYTNADIDVMKALITLFLPKEYKIVFRPDSGNPTTAVIQALQTGEAIFGVKQIFIEKDRYLKELKNSAVIQGDGISVFTIQKILNAVIDMGYSPLSVAFGMGGGLLQKIYPSSVGLKLDDANPDTSLPLVTETKTDILHYWETLRAFADNNWRTSAGGRIRRSTKKRPSKK